MNIRVLPPAGGGTIVANGRTYTCAANSFLDVPDFDAQVMAANGWHIVAKDGVGATAQRPSNPAQNTKYFDTTVGAEIVFHAGQWRSKATGAVA